MNLLKNSDDHDILLIGLQSDLEVQYTGINASMGEHLENEV